MSADVVAGVPVTVVIKAAGFFEDAGELDAARPHIVNVGAGGFMAVGKGALLLSRNDSVERRFSVGFLISCLKGVNCMAVGRRGEFGQHFPPPVAIGGPAHGQFERGFAARPAPYRRASEQSPAQGV
jgi:hypothetical protein